MLNWLLLLAYMLVPSFSFGMFPSQIYNREHQTVSHAFPHDILYSQLAKKKGLTDTQRDAFQLLLTTYKDGHSVVPAVVAEYKKLRPREALDTFRDRIGQSQLDNSDFLRDAYYLALRSLGGVPKADALTSPVRRRDELRKKYGIRPSAIPFYIPKTTVSPTKVSAVQAPSSSSSSSSSSLSAVLQADVQKSFFVPSDSLSLSKEPMPQPKGSLQQSQQRFFISKRLSFNEEDAPKPVFQIKPAAITKSNAKKPAVRSVRPSAKRGRGVYTAQEQNAFTRHFVPREQGSEVVVLDNEGDDNVELLGIKRSRND